MLENHMSDLYKNFAPHFNIPGKSPYEICGNLTLLGPANNIMLEYLKAQHDHPEKDTILRELIN
nr:MAG TPA: hypothetical protein [Caudoviricetes sp.]DAR26158.1 MAG TPA: hypothetical protein [Caudoviricetes sp.]